jgi:hypothetical protein
MTRASERYKDFEINAVNSDKIPCCKPNSYNLVEGDLFEEKN